MPHSVGALLLPAPVPEPRQSVSDPLVDVLADFFSAVLTAWLGSAWNAIAPGEPIVRTVRTHNPEEDDFLEGDLPLLSVWRDEDIRPKRLTDTRTETETRVMVLWVPQPVTQQGSASRYPFFAGFQKAISTAVLYERAHGGVSVGPIWIHPADADPASAGYDEAVAYGSNARQHAGADSWRVDRITRTTIEIEGGHEALSYPAYLATLTVTESSSINASNSSAGTDGEWGTYPTVIVGDLTSGGDTPLTRQQFRVPKTDP